MPPLPPANKRSNAAHWLTGSGFALAVCALARCTLLFVPPSFAQDGGQPGDTAPTVSDTSQFKNHDATMGEAFRMNSLTKR